MTRNIYDLSKEDLEEYLEELTFRNILLWRRPQLLRILRGEKAVNVIPESNQRSKLYRDGVLEAVYPGGGKAVALTPRAIRLLGEEL